MSRCIPSLHGHCTSLFDLTFEASHDCYPSAGRSAWRYRRPVQHAMVRAGPVYVRVQPALHAVSERLL